MDDKKIILKLNKIFKELKNINANKFDEYKRLVKAKNKRED
ncbi:hypothetical protein RHK27_02980 [Clostridioides difficile]|nr:hypothetical protein [Clostridioides difficile]